MKFSKKLSKVMAMTAMSAMLLSMTASAAEIRTPNMGGVSTQYSSMVTAANSFDPNLGSLIADAFSNACYTTAAIDNAIANTNNAITAINNIQFATGDNITGVRDVAGSVSTAVNYLTNAGLTNAVTFSLEKKFVSGSSEFFNSLEFKVITKLYTASPAKELVGTGTTVENRTAIIDQLRKYINLLNAVKAFDQAAGCYDTTNTTSAPANTTSAPANTQAPITSDDDEVEAAFIEAEDVEIYVGDDFDIMDSAYAEDLDGNDITDLITVDGEVNTAVAGEYDVTYSVGGEEVTITVTVLDTTPDTSDAIINASDITLAANAEFDPMDGVSAIDDGGNGADISNLLTVIGTVNTAVPGTYKLTYCVIGENGNQVAKDVIVTVEKELVHAVIEAEDRTIQLGEAFDPMEGVSAYDIEGRDKDLTDKIKVDGKVNTGITGEYQLTYRVTGSSGVEVTKTVTITVERDTKDAIIMAYDRTVACDSDFDPMKDIKAIDNNGAGRIITGNVEVDGYVDTKVEADYLLTYSVIGSSGIKVTKDVTITVSCDVDNCDVDTTEEPWEDTTEEDTTEEWIDTTEEDTTEEPWEDTTEEDTTEDTTVAPVDTTSAPVDTTEDPTCLVPVIFPIGWIIPLGTVDTTAAPVNTTCWIDTTAAPVNTTCALVVNTTCAPVVDTTCWIVDPAPVAPVDTTCWIVDTAAPVAPVETTCWIVDTTAAPVAPVDTTCWIVEPVDTTVVLPVDTSEEPEVNTTCAPVAPVAPAPDTTCAPVAPVDPGPVDDTDDPNTTCWVVEPEDPGPADDTDDPNTTCWVVEPEDPGPADDTDDPNTTCWVVEPEDPGPADDTDDPNTTCWVVEPEDPGPVDDTDDPNTTCAPVEDPGPADDTDDPGPADDTDDPNTTCAPVDDTDDPTVVEPVDTSEEPAVDTTSKPSKPAVNTTCWVVDLDPVDTTEAPTVVGPTDTTEAPADTTEAPVVEDTTEAPVEPVDTTEAPAINTTCAPVGPTEPDTTEAPVGPEPDTTEAPVGPTEPVDTTDAPAINTTCAPVGPAEPDTTETPAVDTTCWVVEDTTEAPTVDTTCEPIRIVVDPIKVEIIKTETVDTTCAPVAPVEPADTTEEPWVDTTEEPVKVPENTMKPTGANLAELVFSTLTLVGTAIFAKKRR